GQCTPTGQNKGGCGRTDQQGKPAASTCGAFFTTGAAPCGEVLGSGHPSRRVVPLRQGNGGALGLLHPVGLTGSEVDLLSDRGRQPPVLGRRQRQGRQRPVERGGVRPVHRILGA